MSPASSYYYFCPFHQFSSLNYEQFLTKHVVFIIYARDYPTAWSSFAFCVVLRFSALSDILKKTKVVFVQHILIMVLKMQFSTCFDSVFIL